MSTIRYGRQSLHEEFFEDDYLDEDLDYSGDLTGFGDADDIQLLRRNTVNDEDDNELTDGEEDDDVFINSQRNNNFNIRDKKRHLICLNINMLGYNFLWFVLLVVFIPSQVRSMVPSDKKGMALGFTLAIGAVISLFGSPLMGIISDMSSSKFGRRRPYMVFGGLGMIVSCYCLALSNTHIIDSTDVQERCGNVINNNTMVIETGSTKLYGSYAAFVVSYCFVSLFSIVLGVSYNGLLADKTPTERRGLGSGFMAGFGSVGNLCGAALGLFYADIGVINSYTVVLCCFLFTLLITTISTPEQQNEFGQKNKNWPSIKDVAMGYITPLKDHDFRWVFLTRFLMQQGIATVTSFLQYFLADSVELPNGISAERALSITMLPMLVIGIPSALFAGIISDKLGKRRKVIVVISGVLMLIPVFVAIFVRNFIVLVVAFAFFGIGYGSYQSVDFAMVIDVLPNPENAAKDLAVWHTALVLPQMLAAPIGGVLRDVFQNVGCGCECGMGYVIIFGVAFLYLLLSVIFVFKIRKVK